MQNYEPGCAGNPDTYRTGSTNPPKSYRGIIAVLLILVILLISIVTVLGMMNIRLFRLLEQQAESSVEFSENGAAEASLLSISQERITVPELGLTGEEIENVYRSYNQWPQGLYISQIQPGSPAENADIRLGDILVAVDGVPVTGKADLQEKMVDLQPGQPLLLTFYREDSELTVPLTPIEP